MTVRPTYRPFVTERFVAAPRERVWEALLDFLDAGTGGYDVAGDPAPHGPGATKRFAFGEWQLTEVTVSLEPPWRRVYAITEGAPVRSYQGTTVLIEEPGGTRLVWSCLVEPLDGDASEAYEARLRTAIPKAVGLVAATAEAGA